jgi:cytidyltransferase-like protein
MKLKKVFVSGCFDMLRSGHIRFLEKAAEYGEVYVAIGADRTAMELKGRAPVTTENERKYMLEAVRHMKQCVVSRSAGILDFVDELKRIEPDIFIVNEDGNTPAKARRPGAGCTHTSCASCDEGCNGTLYLLAAGCRSDRAMRDWEACRHRVEAAILAAPAKRDGFQPRVPKADTASHCTR